MRERNFGFHIGKHNSKPHLWAKVSPTLQLHIYCCRKMEQTCNYMFIAVTKQNKLLHGPKQPKHTVPFPHPNYLTFDIPQRTELHCHHVEKSTQS